MSQSTVLKSFAELAEFFDVAQHEASQREGDGVPMLVGAATLEGPTDLAALLAQIEDASATLATVARQDHEVRTLALRDLEQYDAAIAARREAERVHEGARKLRQQAGDLVESAFADEARAAARQVAAIAARAEKEAADHLDARRIEVESLDRRLDFERLLNERRREEEAERTRAAEAERAARLNEEIARARLALDSGDFEEARALLGPLGKDNPDNAEVAYLDQIIARREVSVKIDAAEEILNKARRQYRRDPTTAVKQLAHLNVNGLPDPLGRQVFGEWARACSRLCRERGLVAPLRYARDPGRGAVLARESANAPYTVLSALGMDEPWQPGTVVPDRLIRQARPLR